mmetsp:Transcript_29749/g.81312  ORF Transcript_29749/g.81312 Transcript_29749/m.81312 type:complete len:268 (-) Transcript_29749:2424-3227(-)
MSWEMGTSTSIELLRRSGLPCTTEAAAGFTRTEMARPLRPQQSRCGGCQLPLLPPRTALAAGGGSQCDWRVTYARTAILRPTSALARPRAPFRLLLTQAQASLASRAKGAAAGAVHTRVAGRTHRASPARPNGWAAVAAAKNVTRAGAPTPSPTRRDRRLGAVLSKTCFTTRATATRRASLPAQSLVANNMSRVSSGRKRLTASLAFRAARAARSTTARYSQHCPPQRARRPPSRSASRPLQAPSSWEVPSRLSSIGGCRTARPRAP